MVSPPPPDGFEILASPLSLLSFKMVSPSASLSLFSPALQSPTILFPKSNIFPLSFHGILPIRASILLIQALIAHYGKILGFLKHLGLDDGLDHPNLSPNPS